MLTPKSYFLFQNQTFVSKIGQTLKNKKHYLVEIHDNDLEIKWYSCLLAILTIKNYQNTRKIVSIVQH